VGTKRFWILLMLIISFLIFGTSLAFAAIGNNLAVLQPAGEVGQIQGELLVFSLLLSLTVIIPVFALTLFIAVRYREGNAKASYRPDWSHSKMLEIVWWGIPIILIGILSVIIWQSSHSLDPSKPLTSSQPPVKVQVIALQWRWLFIYPEQGVASVNRLEVPINRPIEFKITADAPMNSFWIPKLGGQIYAMPGMATTLNLNATESGKYTGLSTNISGEGYADMQFPVYARSPEGFEEWVKRTSKLNSVLTTTEYAQLAQPQRNTAELMFAKVEDGLFDRVVNKYMMPSVEPNTTKIPFSNHTITGGY